MSLSLSAHQPAFLPWLGYFEKVMRSDKFVYLDTVQYEKYSYINRNQIKTPQGPIWLTVPVKSKGHLNRTLLDLEIDNHRKWREKHLRAIAMHYRKTPRFPQCFPKLEAMYHQTTDNFCDFCFEFLKFWLKELGITTEIVRAKDLRLTGSKADLVLDLCRQMKAGHFLAGALGKNYLEPTRFAQEGITLEFQSYLHPVYPQLYGDFLPNLSVVDFWMNTNDYRLILGVHNGFF